MSDLAFIGPFESYDVVLNGRKVPFLHATLLSGGKIDLTLDRRYALVLSVQDAEYVVPFIAHCIAVAMGFAGHPDSPDAPLRPAQPMSRMRSFDSAVLVRLVPHDASDNP